jgi:parallel beta helix pectate lyase-like protein
MRQSITALSAVVVVLLFTIPVSATNQRSFVASNGADANPCTRDLPCRNFAAAVLQTNTNGEVIAIDSAGYGPVTITKSVAIIAPPGVHAGISVFAGDGVTVNAGPAEVVVVRNLYINSQGGVNGITLTSAAVLHIEGCVVSGFSSNDINLVPSPSASVAVNDTVVRQAGAAGIFADSANPLTVSIDHCRAELNVDGVVAEAGSIFIRNTHAYANSGNSFNAESNTSPTTFVIENSSVAGIGGSSQGIRLGDTIAAVHNTIISGMHYGIVAGMGAVASVETCLISKNAIAGITVAGGADVSVSNSTIADNNGGGITVTDGVVRVSHCTITRNSVGLNNLGGTLLSAGDNTVDGNSSQSSGTIGLATKM